MEEKKNEKGAEVKHNKKNNSRRHGYFIEPPSENKTAPAKDAANAEPQKRDEQRNHQNQRKNKHHNKKGDNKAAQTAEQSKQQQLPQENQPAKTTAAEPRANGKNNRKNKNKNAAQKPQQQENKTQAQNVSENKNPKKTPPLDKNARSEKPVITHNADEYEEYVWFEGEETPVFPAGVTKQKEQGADEPKTEIVGVRFKSTGKTYFFDPQGKKYSRGSGAIVDTARGQEYGEIAMPNSFVNTSEIVPPLRHVIRAATTADVEHHKENKKKEDEAFRICNEQIASHKLDMKLIDAQYTFDNSKLLFYFTSSERVDFRELVKDLAAVFRTRIELRQIGIRDEAKLMGGLGMCGRPLCCSLFLSDFNQVSIKMAKEQNLSLNSAKISGICGRLMCCLKYEHEVYEDEIKRTPPVDSIVRTENGDGVITEISPLAGTVKVKLFAAPEAPAKSYRREDIKMLRKKQK